MLHIQGGKEGLNKFNDILPLQISEKENFFIQLLEKEMNDSVKESKLRESRRENIERKRRGYRRSRAICRWRNEGVKRKKSSVNRER